MWLEWGIMTILELEYHSIFPIWLQLLSQDWVLREKHFHPHSPENQNRKLRVKHNIDLSKE